MLLRQHERTHENERPFECPEDGCDKSFFRKSHLQVHQLSHRSDGEKPFQCPICGKGAISPQLLKRHELTHTKKYKCTHEGCSMAFYHYQSLNHHVEIVHKQSLVCNVCNKRFQRPFTLNQHKLKHHGEAQMLFCEQPGCYESFMSRDALQAHVLLVHPKIKCTHCDAVITGTKEYAAHSAIHGVQAEAKLWTCQSCTPPVQFVRKAELVRHYRDFHDSDVPDEIVATNEGLDLATLLSSTESKSLHSSLRDPSFAAEIDLGDFKPDGRRKTLAEPASEPLPKSASIIGLVLGNDKKVYTCARKNCRKKFVRHHAYMKHIEWHKRELEKNEAFLQAAKEEEEFTRAILEKPLENRSDTELQLDDYSVGSEDDISIASEQLLDSPEPTEPFSGDDAAEKLILSEIAAKQQELDALMFLEMEEG